MIRVIFFIRVCEQLHEHLLLAGTKKVLIIMIIDYLTEVFVRIIMII